MRGQDGEDGREGHGVACIKASMLASVHQITGCNNGFFVRATSVYAKKQRRHAAFFCPGPAF
jgi:hypothetical protein